MADLTMPYGAEFSPEKINIKDLLKLAKKQRKKKQQKIRLKNKKRGRTIGNRKNGN